MTRHACFLPIFLVSLVAACPAFGLTIIGHVVNTEGDPVEGAGVWVSQEGRVQQTETGPDGAYRFDGLRVGSIELTALKTGRAIGGRTAFAVGDTEIRLVLVEPGSASVRVLDRRGRPIPGARVKTLAVGGQFLAPVEALAPHGFPTLRADDEGVIRIPFVPARGYVQAVIWHTGYVESPATYLPDREKQAVLVLRDGLRFRGRVLYEGRPAPGTRVSVFQNTPRGRKKVSETITDDDGLFRTVVLPGVYYVALRHPDYASPEPQQVGISYDTQDKVHVFSLITPCVISGRVCYPDGRGFGGVRVAYREGKVIYEDVFTDVDGNYILKVPGNSGGFLRVYAPPGYMTDIKEELPLAIGEQRLVHVQDLMLVRLPTIQGTILVDGAPADHVLVATINLINPSLAITDEAGHFSLSLSDIPEGKILLARAEHAFRFLRKDFAVHLDQPNPVELTLESFTPNQIQEPEKKYRNDLKALVDDPAPDIECDTWWNSDPIQMSDLKGKVVVLTMWAGFDRTPVGVNRIQEMRALHALYADTDDVLIIGVHDGSSLPSEIENYIRSYGITFPVGRDKVPLVTFDHYGVNAIPQTVLIDKQGILRYYQIEGRLLELVKVLRRRG